MRALLALATSLSLAGCVTASTDVVRFKSASPQQEALLRDGQSVILSRSRNSIVTLRPATRQILNGRPVFVVEIQNTSKKPLDFRVSDIVAQQTGPGETRDLKVYSYDELVQEEKQAQVGRAVGVALVSGLNSYSAGNHYWRQARASDENAELAAAVAQKGAQNLAALEAMTLKDDTLLPGETYGGRLVLQGPEAGDASLKTYTLTIAIGPDTHRIQVVQGPSV